MIKIYKLTTENTPSVYIGSTKVPKLQTRLNQHRQQFKLYQRDGRASMSSFELMKYSDVKISLIKEVDASVRDEEESEAQKTTPNCINIRDPKKYQTTRPKKRDGDDHFTDDQNTKISNCPTKNAEYVLRNYYRYKNEKLKYHALKRVRNTGLLPRATTIDKYKISADEILEAVRTFQRN